MDENYIMKSGQVLRQLREAKGLSRKKLLDRLPPMYALSERHYIRTDKGKHAISPIVLSHILQILGTTMVAVLDRGKQLVRADARFAWFAAVRR